jgi:hypothetical protein
MRNAIVWPNIFKIKSVGDEMDRGSSMCREDAKCTQHFGSKV